MAVLFAGTIDVVAVSNFLIIYQGSLATITISSGFLRRRSTAACASIFHE